MTGKYSVTCVMPVYNAEDYIIRALESIPKHWQIAMVDDCSTDNTYNLVHDWLEANWTNYSLERNDKNRGVGMTVARAKKLADNDYLIILDSDDYFYPAISEVEARLDGSDLVYFDIINDLNRRYNICFENRVRHCASVKFMRREFVKDIPDNDLRAGEDKAFMLEMVKHNPTEIYTGILARHYTFPRAGSLSDLAKRKLI